ncbi:aminomethyltransferase family protein [Peptoniphilus sp.]|jgi:aminomethyltransferase|uniref:aminomethyltransferase family protein n=1 Tax=Peptoniphilus sp. TaxID=1971214 RepID=UPI003D91DB5A
MKDEALLRKKEHEAVRNGVGYYDFTHQLLNVTGPDAGKFLDKIFVNSIQGIDVGKAVYSTTLNENGIIIDDVIIFRIEDERYWISTLYIKELIEWLDSHKDGEDVSYEDITSKVTMFAVQGPKSRDLINKLVDKSIEDLKFFHIIDNSVGDLKIKVARAGYTGELGFELYVPSDKKELLEEKLQEAGKEFDLCHVTTDVIVSSLPAEKGYVLMSDLKDTNPLEVGYGWTVHWDGDFIGKDALLKAKENVTRDLLGFEVEDKGVVIEPGAKVYAGDKEVGYVTKYTYGFTVGKNIGYALVNLDDVKEGDAVEVGPDKVKTKLCDRVFYDKENERVKG